MVSDPISDVAEKSTLRIKYNEAAEELRTLYTQQKSFQEEIKSVARKAKKRVAPDNNFSRWSPQKKAKKHNHNVSAVMSFCALLKLSSAESNSIYHG